MALRFATFALVALAVSACTPKADELDGASELDGAPAATPGAPGELAGSPAASGAVLPGIINLTPPSDMQVIEDCQAIVAADYTNPPTMTCLLFTEADQISTEVHPPFLSAMNAAGWQYVRSVGSERYFERPRAGTDCADLAAVSVVGDRLQALVDHVAPKDGPPILLPTHTVWRAYAITASTRETCGNDRMKP